MFTRRNFGLGMRRSGRRTPFGYQFIQGLEMHEMHRHELRYYRVGIHRARVARFEFCVNNFLPSVLDGDPHSRGKGAQSSHATEPTRFRLAHKGD